MRFLRIQLCIWAVMLISAISSAAWMAAKTQRARDVAVPGRARREHVPLPVRTVSVTKREYVDSIGATVVTVPSETASIWVGGSVGLRNAGMRVQAVHVVEGQVVQEGELLIELDDEVFAQAVKRQEMALDAAQAALRSIKQLRRNKAATGLQLRDAEVRVEVAQLELQVAQRDLERCKVRSPIQGFADVINVALGEEVDSGREFTKIHKLDPIHLRVDFPQERLDDVFIGQTAQVVLDSFPQEEFAAKVIRVAPQADPETRILPVVLEMENSKHRIRAGLTGFARLAVGRQALVVPNTAVVKRGSQAMVFCVDQGHAQIRKVRLGSQVDIGAIEVLEGLCAGDKVVIHGSEFLRNSDPVNDDWRHWARRK